MNEKKNGPYKKSRMGRFQISLFRNKKIIPAKDDFSIEREFISERACIQYSQYVQGEWRRQQIWCSPNEIRDLVNALDGLNT